MIPSVRWPAALAALLLLGACADAPRRPNLVLVVMDTVRRDATGLVDDTAAPWRQGQLTPTLDRLVAEGTAFPLAFSTAPWTVPSHVSMLTGLLPSEHGCSMMRPRVTDRVGPTVAEELAVAGYETAAFFSNPWLTDAATGMLRGFAIREAAPIGGLGQMTSASGDQGGAQTLANVQRWLGQRNADAPFFLFVNLLEAHLPYDPPARVRSTDLSDLPGDARVTIDWGHEFNAGLHAPESVDWSQVRRLYGGDVRAADLLLHALVRMLAAAGDLDETVLVVTSDHGENLGDHDLMEHQFSVHETVLAVPLVIRAPSRLASGVRTEPVLGTDVYATLLDAAGLGATPRVARNHSRSLLQPADAAARGRAVFGQYAGPSPGLVDFLATMNPSLERAPLLPARRTVRVGPMRLSTAGDAPPQLHDMIADPLQQRDLAAAQPEVAAALLELLERASAFGSPGAPATGAPAPGAPVTGAPVDLDPETAEQLRALGYVR